MLASLFGSRHLLALAEDPGVSALQGTFLRTGGLSDGAKTNSMMSPVLPSGDKADSASLSYFVRQRAAGSHGEPVGVLESKLATRALS